MTTPTPTVSPKLRKLLERTAMQKQLFSTQYPELYTQVIEPLIALQPSSAQSTGDQPKSNIGTALSSFARQVTAEEHAAVLEKATAAAQLPPGLLGREDTLYLEEQLSELLTFEVTTELDGHALPFSHGIVAAAPHLRIAPTDSAIEHSPAYAHFSEKRSFFGWLTTRQNSVEQLRHTESFGIAFPILQLPEWSSTPQATSEWYLFRKMVVINPIEKRAVVVRVIDDYTAVSAKYTFAAMPEVILQGKCWSPRTLGRVLLFFVVDPTDRIPVGPLSLAFTESPM